MLDYEQIYLKFVQSIFSENKKISVEIYYTYPSNESVYFDIFKFGKRIACVDFSPPKVRIYVKSCAFSHHLQLTDPELQTKLKQLLKKVSDE